LGNVQVHIIDTFIKVGVSNPRASAPNVYYLTHQMHMDEKIDPWLPDIFIGIDPLQGIWSFIVTIFTLEKQSGMSVTSLFSESTQASGESPNSIHQRRCLDI
jgi:hypothetical protein